MSRIELTTRFSERLNLKLRETGYHSKRISGGVQLTELANIAGVSYQMARKYSSGIALPEPEVVMKIARWLNVSPGWLIFGEDTSHQIMGVEQIVIQRDLLSYILSKIFEIFSLDQTGNNIIDYTLEVIYDASHLNTDIAMTKKIVDMMLSSALVLNKSKVKNTA